MTRNLGDRLTVHALFYTVPTLLLAATLGGQAALGRVDPALAIPWMMPGALLLAWRLRKLSLRDAALAIVAALMLFAGFQFSIQFGLSLQSDATQILVALVAGMCACAVAVMLLRLLISARAFWRWIVFPLTAILWFLASLPFLANGYAARNQASPPRLTVVTGLPLRWAGGGDLSAMLQDGPQDAPVLTALQNYFTVHMVDTLDGVSPRDPLLVAHPRALAPAELVRIDDYVRQGGHAVVMADALSSWHPAYPLGDPRNPPITSLLTPLLDHWGVALAAPVAGRDDGVVAVDLMAKNRLLLQSAGRFARLPSNCVEHGKGRLAFCWMGRGSVWLVADADMLDAPLWQLPHPQTTWLAPSDNIVWLATALRGDDARPLLRPIWSR